MTKRSGCRSANDEGQVIENAPLNLLRSLDPNAAPESVIGCNAFERMHLLDLSIRELKNEGLALCGLALWGSSATGNQLGAADERPPLRSF